MDSVTSLNAIRDTLRTHLTDPYVYAGGKTRDASTWIWANEPHSTFKYPQIEIKKVDNPSEPISIGANYWEQEQVFANIWFYSKNGFKLTVSGTEYKNAQLVEYYLGQIKQTLKANFAELACADANGYKHVNTTRIEYDTDTQLYYGAVTVRVRFFQQ